MSKLDYNGIMDKGWGWLMSTLDYNEIMDIKGGFCG